MSVEKRQFNEAGLVFDKERVLTYSRLVCPLDCRYCFVNDLHGDQQRGVSYLSEQQAELLQQLPEEISLIMLGCDTEFFQRRDDALKILQNLSRLGKDISVITKLALTTPFIRRLGEIATQLQSRGNILSFSVSLPCLESSTLWEPRAPKPARRIAMLGDAFAEKLQTLVAIRPLLPTVSDDELRRVIENTSDACIGYYSGPLYLKELNEQLLPSQMREDLKIEQLQPHWMPEGNLFYKIERPGQMEFLTNLITQRGKKLFTGAAEANQYLKTI